MNKWRCEFVTDFGLCSGFHDVLCRNHDLGTVYLRVEKLRQDATVESFCIDASGAVSKVDGREEDNIV